MVCTPTLAACVPRAAARWYGRLALFIRSGACAGVIAGPSRPRLVEGGETAWACLTASGYTRAA